MNKRLKDVLSVGVGILSGVGVGLGISKLLEAKKEVDCKNMIRSMMFWLREECNEYLEKGDAISAQAVWDTYVGTVREHIHPLTKAGLEDVIEEADYIFNIDEECEYVFVILESLRGTIRQLQKVKNCNKDNLNSKIKTYNMVRSLYASMLKEADYKRWKTFEPIDVVK